MASIKNLKKEVSYVLGQLIDIVTIWEIATGKKQNNAEPLVEEIISTYDVYIKKINQRQTQRNSTYFASLRKELEQDVTKLVEKINSLN